MRHVIRRAFWNYEKEEKWLNEMSAKGFALVDYTWCRYVFEDCQPGEYIHRIELLESQSNQPEGVRYIQFMEESGAEQIATYMQWAYFRKKSAAGAFDIYSDLGSRISHYRRVMRLWLLLSILELVVGIFNVLLGALNYFWGYYSSLLNPNFVLGSVTLAIGVGLLWLAIYYWRKVARLKREHMLME